MLKPNNFDNVQTGDFTPPMVGGHHMDMLGVKEQQSKTGKGMLVAMVDFAANDKQPGYFKKLYDSDVRPDKKWPHAGTIYIVTTDNNGQCSKSFKNFITSFCESNGLKDINWTNGPEFCEQFKGKKIGGVYGRVEEEYNGERRMRTLLRWFCSDAKAYSVNPPADKLMKEPANTYPTASTAVTPDPSGFTQINTDDLPWPV